MISRIISIVALMGITTLSHAQGFREDIGSSLDKCKQNAISTIDSQNCYEVAKIGWDRELSTQYNLLMKD